MQSQYSEYYEDVKRTIPFSLRGLFRDAALNTLSAIDKVKNIDNDLKRPRVQFLYIHHIFRDEEKPFDQLLSRLARHHHFISYSDAVEKILTGTIDKPYVCFSSDDGFKNNLRAAEILSSHGASACFFINPDLIGETRFDVIKKHTESRLKFPPVEFLTWDEVDSLLKSGHEIGSHTMYHFNVADVSAEEFRSDCEQAKSVIAKHCGQVGHFAFPYGRFFNFNDSARKIIFETGFRSCATAERGCHINHDTVLKPEDLCLRRDLVILDWNPDHIFYFMARNSSKASVRNNLYPY